MDIFRVRLNCVDHYQATPSIFDPQVPFASYDGSERIKPKVPVIRIFGATETGQKVCAHVHGAFPYLFISYNGSTAPEDVNAYIQTLQVSIDHALAISYRRNPTSGNAVFVAHITVVKGVQFYGYRVGYDVFLKIYLLNPLNMTRLADLLRQGAIMGKSLQPYESHMQYLAQWMCDYNLYGCAYVDCAQPKFRSPIPFQAEFGNHLHKWHDQSIDIADVLDPETYPKQSHCSIEVDIHVADLLNRNDVKPREIHHDFVERSLSPIQGEKLVQSMAGLWRDETKRRKERMGLQDPSSSPFPPEVLLSVSADPRNTQPGGWIHESEYRQKIDEIIGIEKEKCEDIKPSFESFVIQPHSCSDFQTTLDSVRDLFPANILRAKEERQLTQQSISDTHPAFGVPQVDESRLLSYLTDEFLLNQDDSAGKAPENDREVDEEPHRKGDVSPSKEIDLVNQPDDTDSGVQEQVVYFGKPMSELSLTELSMLGVVRITLNVDLDNAFEMDEELLGDIDEERMQHQNERPEMSSKRRKMDNSTVNKSKIANRANLINRGGDHSGEESPRLSSRGSATSNTQSQRHTLSQKSSLPRRGEISSRPAAQPHNWTSLSLSAPHTTNGPNSITQRPNNLMGRIEIPAAGNAPSSDPKTTTSDRQQRTATSSQSFQQYESNPSSHVQSMGKGLGPSFCLGRNTSMYCFRESPPRAAQVSGDLSSCSLPSVLYRDAYYSRDSDVPERSREYAGKDFRLESDSISYLPAFNDASQVVLADAKTLSTDTNRETEEKNFARRRQACNLRVWEIKATPPSRQEVSNWADSSPIHRLQKDTLTQGPKHEERPVVSQIDLATQRNKHGFKYSQNKKSSKVKFENQYMSVMSVEVHVNTRGAFVPNPEEDEVCCIFWALHGNEMQGDTSTSRAQAGIIMLSLDENVKSRIRPFTPVELVCEPSELDMINRLVDTVRYQDPDIITGYEVHGSSWGYLIERARLKFDYDLCDEFSRVRTDSHGRFGKEEDRWGFNHTSTIRVTGRHMINIWRAMRGELNLSQYTLENVVFQQCHRRVPHYDYSHLTKWFRSGKPRDLARVIEYFMSRVRLDLEILDQNELVPRTSEQARLLGVDFFSVFSRGSQFKVESLMFRIAKPENLLLPSPSRKQVGQQNALECLPLVMEPESSFFNSPLLVLDFQSLYPSIMIAYNYCYSTCLGRVVNWRGQNKMGFTDYHRQPRVLELLRNDINVAPNGMMYVRPNIRKSLLAKMLGEILETRVMVKSGMKVDKDDKNLQRLLNNRQLALKLIANVTYGYTSASFSGRMPCSEIADSIVQTGRETLEKAIALIHSVDRWGADVVYGDTDSLFVYLKGRTKDEAFTIGNEIARTITDMNPRPVKLKFEKVYFPCVLLAKKRYVGFKYESRDQKVPDFDAKGIETVRRDGTPSAQKIEEKALKILFRTADLSQIKRFFQDQCEKIMRGSVSIQDFCFAKEVKLGTYSDKGPPPPGALISTKKMLLDPRAEPQYGERVPYVVIAGGPGARLIDRCVPPEALLHDDNAELDAEYYIGKHLIPPLERIFNLMGANVRQWYDEMPKFQRIRRVEASANLPGRDSGLTKKTLESYMKSSSCLICREKLEEEIGICDRCATQSDRSLFDIQSRSCLQEWKLARLERICRSCANLPWGDEIRCDSKDCPVFYARCRQRARLHNVSAFMTPLKDRLENTNWQENIAW